jgi:hypothetical protein
MSLYAVNFLWILFTGIGVLLAIYGFGQSRLDLAALNALKKNGEKKTLATGNILDQLVLGIGQMSFLIPGLLSLGQPEPSQPFGVATALLLVGSLAMTTSSAINIYINHRIQ